MSAFDRRSVLIGGAGTVLGGALITANACPPSTTTATADAGPPPTQDRPPDSEMTVAEVLPILAAVCERLMPSDDLGPGVKECNIGGYLERALADKRMRAIKSMVTRGAVFLGRAARKENGKAFWELTDVEKDNLITRLANNQVRPSGFSPVPFVKVMLALSLECFLGDPRHGGNTNEIGWKFVGGINWTGRQP